MFTKFPELPAELRARIWNLALQAELGKFRRNPSRLIELHSFDPKSSTIDVKVSRRYPNLFAVNHEARYEAAKIQGYEWVPIYSRYTRDNGKCDSASFEICINFKTDHLFLSERFSRSGFQQAPDDPNLKPEQIRLNMLANMLGSTTLQKLQGLIISTIPPRSARHLGSKSYWMGEGLENFQLGNLRMVTVLTRYRGHLGWAKPTIEDYLEMHWVRLGCRNEYPLVCGQAFLLQTDEWRDHARLPKILSTNRGDITYTSNCIIPTSNMDYLNEMGIICTE